MAGSLGSQHFGRARPAITVVGAGPSGLTCAIALARANYSVTVHEWRPQIGARFHGDFQGLENWSSDEDVLQELARNGVEPTFDYYTIRSGVGFDAWGARYEIRSEKPLYYLVRRGRSHGTLDQALLRQAQALGVNVLLNDRVKQAEHGPVCTASPASPGPASNPKDDIDGAAASLPVLALASSDHFSIGAQSKIR